MSKRKCPNCNRLGRKPTNGTVTDKRVYRHCPNRHCAVRLFATDKDWFK